jgi:hypothetical protein
MTLIDRLAKLDGPDREVDAEIALQNGWSVFPGDNWIGPEAEIVVPDYTRSVDAAIALAERALPGWRVENLCEWEDETLRSRGPWTCDLRKNGENFFSPLKGKCGHAPTPAIALCIAILRAKETSKP